MPIFEWNAQRKRNLYEAGSNTPYRFSRSKIEQYIRCPHCLYLDVTGVKQPPGYPFNLNTAVDTKLKTELDWYRMMQQPHPLAEQMGLRAVPLQHKKIDEWREPLRQGITYLMPGTNLLITGGVDDVWKNQDTGELIIVDYKSTSKDSEHPEMVLHDSYKHQMDIYRWLFLMNGFPVAQTAYFLYCNADTVGPFLGKLDFKMSLVPYESDESWVGPLIRNIYAWLQSPTPPPSGANCDYCSYYNARHGAGGGGWSPQPDDNLDQSDPDRWEIE